MSRNEVCVVDYGLGNLRSVENGLHAAGVACRFVRTPEEVCSAGRLLLPGVGAFNAGMRNLRKDGLGQAIREAVAKGTPLLGICLGMQLLVSRGDEGGMTEGLDLIPGEIRLFGEVPELRIPHMGFNEVEISFESPLFNNINNRSDFYFVHSFHAVVADKKNEIASATYGERFSAVIGMGHVIGTQFHPEKSQSQGLQLLKNFCAI